MKSFWKQISDEHSITHHKDHKEKDPNGALKKPDSSRRKVTGPCLVVFNVNVDFDETAKFFPENTSFLDLECCKDDCTGTIGRLYLCMLLSDLIVVDVTKNTSRWVWMLIDRFSIEKSNVLFVGSKKKSGNAFPSIGKKPTKWTNWVLENMPNLYRQKIKVQSKDKFFTGCIGHYIRNYIEKDPPIKDLYWYEPRARPLIDSLMLCLPENQKRSKKKI